MDATTQLQADSNIIAALLQRTVAEAGAFLQGLANRPVNNDWQAGAPEHLPAQGIGAQATAFSNWRTTVDDVEVVWAAMVTAAQEAMQEPGEANDERT